MGINKIPLKKTKTKKKLKQKKLKQKKIMNNKFNLNLSFSLVRTLQLRGTTYVSGLKNYYPGGNIKCWRKLKDLGDNTKFLIQILYLF